MNLELFTTDPVYFTYKIIQWIIITYISLAMYATKTESLPKPMHFFNMIKKTQGSSQTKPQNGQKKTTHLHTCINKTSNTNYTK
jgi:hypothetical protein